MYPLHYRLPGSNRPHAGRLIPSIRLRAVLKIRIRTSGAINANIPRDGNMWTSMRLRHDGDDGDSGSGTHGFGPEFGEQGGAVGVGNGSDHLDELRGAGEAVFAAGGGLEGVEVNGLAAAGEV